MPQPSSSLTTLLRLAASENVTWLTRANAEVLINWVTMDLEEAHAGDALLLDASTITPEKVEDAVKKGVPAVVVLGEIEKPQNLITKEVKDAEIQIASLPPDQDLQSTHRTLLTILINQQAHLMEWGISIHSRLAQMAAEGVGIQGIVRAMSEISGRGILVQDKRLDVLATYSPASLQAVWNKTLEQLGTRDSLPEKLRDRKQAGQEKILLTQDLKDGISRLITSINVGGMARGYLSTVGMVGELDTLDQVITEQGAVVCAVEMARSKAVRETEKRLKGDLLSALLQGELSPRDARLWTENIGLDLNNKHVALRFCWDTESPPSLRRLETFVNGEVARLGYKVIVNPMEAEVVCFCQTDVSEPRPRPEQAITMGRSVIDRAMLKYPDSHPRCGIGVPAKSLSEWGVSFRQAGQALEMARRLAETKPLYYPDLSVYRLLLQIEHSPELLAFQEEILGPLLAYENGEELIRTLEAYFDRNGNLKKTANALYIHRNTLIYRLERIQEITGLDLDNPETRLALQLTLHIRKMLGERIKEPN